MFIVLNIMKYMHFNLIHAMASNEGGPASRV